MVAKGYISVAEGKRTFRHTLTGHNSIDFDFAACALNIIINLCNKYSIARD